MKNEQWGIHWFRRDLRIPGNTALKENWKRTQGKTLGLFCFDSKFLSRSDFSHNRFAFFLKTLRALRQDLLEQGGDLLVIDCAPQLAFAKILKYCGENNFNRPSLISWNRDYEPFARERDKTVESFLVNLGVEVFHSRDHLLFEPHEILKSDKPGDFYQIYSPFARRWFEKMATDEGLSRIQAQHKTYDYFKKTGRRTDLFRMQWKNILQSKNFPFTDAFAEFEKENRRNVTIPIPEAGFFAAFENLQKFGTKAESYKDERDWPAVDGTSKFSMYLKNGSLTVPQVISFLKLHENWWKNSGSEKFLKELVWREFYYSILFHRPEVETKSFLPHYENLPWENNEEWFEKWKSGQTGFPIVDAGMRQLNETGWMHNRVRMIVASFLTKDLLIDWRWGENYFMKQLLDGDLAPNNGGWQWAASTGCDPQPYFRIFNPWLQGQKFDPDGEYIKKFVPELKSVPASSLHNPAAERGFNGYPDPIVDHSVRRKKAILVYKR